jgi:EmrB/QacA subfamily drug resistance transporter
MTSGPAPSAAPRAASSGWALAGLSLSMLLASLGTSIANVGLPSLAQAFGASFQDVQWVVLAYLLAVTASIVTAGRLGDIVGRRRLLLSGIGLFTAASIACAIAPNLGLLIAARAVQGLGAAVLMALTMAFVGEIVPKERTGSAMGLLGAMSAVGTALGPSLGGVLIATLGWHALFLVNVPLGSLAFILARRHLPIAPQMPTADRAGLDPAGTLFLALALAGYALAVTFGRGTFGPHNAALLVATILSAGIFAIVETRVRSPLIQFAMFRDPLLSAGLAMGALVSAIVMSTLVVGPFYLSRGLGLGPAQVGLIMSVGPIAAAIAGVPAGRLADRMGLQHLTLIGLAGVAIGCAALSLAPLTFGVAGYLVPLVVLTMGYALFQTANNTAVMADVGPDKRGLVSGLVNLARNLGLITGTAVLGAVFAFAAASSDITTANAEAVAFGMRITFGAAFALAVAAIVIALGSSALARRAPPTLQPADKTAGS